MVDFNILPIIYWGIMVVNYYFLKSIAAGILLIISIGEIFRIEKIQRYTKLGLWLTFATSIMLPLLLISDLGQPLRFWKLLLEFNYRSPMVWGAWIIGLYFVFGTLTAYFYLREDFANLANRYEGNNEIGAKFFRLLSFNRTKLTAEERAIDDKWLEVLFKADIVLAIGLEMYAGIMLSVNYSRPLWGSPLTPLLFLVSSLTTGAAFLIFMQWIFSLFTTEEETQINDGLVPFFFFGLLIEFFLKLLEVFYFLNSTGRARNQYEYLFSGREAIFTIVVDYLLTLVIPFFIFAVPKFRKDWTMVVGSVLVLIGGFLFKYNLVIGGQILPRTGNEPLEVDFGTHELMPMISLYLAYIGSLLAVFWFMPWKNVDYGFGKYGLTKEEATK